MATSTRLSGSRYTSSASLLGRARPHPPYSPLAAGGSAPLFHRAQRALRPTVRTTAWSDPVSRGSGPSVSTSVHVAKQPMVVRPEDLDGPAPPVVVLGDYKEVTHQQVQDLLSGRVAAIIVRGYQTPEQCQRVVDVLMGIGLTTYLPGVDSVNVGHSYWSAHHSWARVEDYHKMAERVWPVLDEAFLQQDEQVPIKRLLNLASQAQAEAEAEAVLAPGRVKSSVFEEGVELLTLKYGPHFAGLNRVFRSKGHALPHTDCMRRELCVLGREHELDALQPVGQMACNIYHQVPEQGGELALWVNPIIPDDQYLAALKGPYGIPFDEIPPARIIIKPQSGDLVFFDARRLHAVLGVPQGQVPRVSTSFFALYSGAGQPLRLFS